MPSSSITLFRVYSSIITMVESYSFSIVSTKVPINNLAKLIARDGLSVFTAIIRLGRHLQAYSLTSSLGCSFIIVQRRVTVFST